MLYTWQAGVTPVRPHRVLTDKQITSVAVGDRGQVFAISA